MTRQIAELPAADRARIAQALAAARGREAAAEAAAQSEAAETTTYPPGVREAIHAASVEVVDDRPAPGVVAQAVPGPETRRLAAEQVRAQAPAPAGPAPEEPKPKAESETGADAAGACPHCGGDLSQPGLPEPAYGDKMAFLHSVLGEKPFVRDYPLLGGELIVTFRTLTPGEIAAVYRQAYRDRQKGEITEEIDYWERLNRYRLLLQLAGVATKSGRGAAHELPDGLSPRENPHATAFWQSDHEPEPGETLLPEIDRYVVANVLKTEPIFRIVNSACHQFNRLVVKLEAMVDDSDFWQPTGAPS